MGALDRMRWAAVAFASLLALPASAEEPAKCDGTCVSDRDLELFLELAREKKCLQTEKPTFKLDPVRIVVDKDGRVFYSGAAPNPYTLKMTWCGYEAEAQGRVDVVAAMVVPSDWGFRFRLKAWAGILPIEAFNILVENEANAAAKLPTTELEFSDVWDAGVLVDFFHYNWFNVNAAVGFRSLGGGVGADLTRTISLYLGYANTWGTWHHNLNLAFAVALW